MKIVITTIFLFFSTLLLHSQNLDPDYLWINNGRYDSLNNSVVRYVRYDGLKQILYAVSPIKIDRFKIQGENKIKGTVGFCDRDVILLKESKNYQFNSTEKITLHNKDSITINNNGDFYSFKKLNVKPNQISLEKLIQNLIGKTVFEQFDSHIGHTLQFIDQNVVKVKQRGTTHFRKSRYKIINFNGHLILQCHEFTPKLITNINSKHINFIELDYRSGNKKGMLKEPKYETIQEKIIGAYEFYEKDLNLIELNIYPDNTFKYFYQDMSDNYLEFQTKGKWKIEKNTLILFNICTDPSNTNSCSKTVPSKWTFKNDTLISQNLKPDKTILTYDIELTFIQYLDNEH